MTVLEGIQKSAEFLTRKGVDSPRLQAELLLAHVLKTERMRLYLNFEQALSAPQTDVFRDLVVRRGEREPLQQIIGSTCFCGFEIAVNRSVLVPRPETELLAEKASEVLKSKVQSPKSKVELPQSKDIWALDLGTGSGCLAISLARNCDKARIVATDVSSAALECAKGNATKNKVVERIDFRIGNGFGALKPGELFDVIVSNPPYIPTAEIESLQPEVKDWEPRAALDGGTDGLDWYRRIAADGKTFLATDGKIVLEFGDGQAEAIREIFEAEKWIVEGVIQDYSGRPRIAVIELRDDQV